MATFPTNKERTNYARLCRALIDLSTEVLRRVLLGNTKPKDLFSRFQQCKAKLTPKELSSLNIGQIHQMIRKAASVGSYKEFDITLLYQMIRILSINDLRDTLSTLVKPHQIKAVIQNCPALTTALNKEEEKIVSLVETSGSYDHCNDSLLHKLYIHLCNPQKNVIHPSKLWGEKPDPHSTDLGDDIENIRDLRNSIYGHISSTEIGDRDFHTYWTTLEGIMVRMDTVYTGGNFKNTLDHIKTCCMDDEMEKKYCTEMEELKKREETNEMKIEEIDTKVKGLEASMTEMRSKNGEEKSQINTRMEGLETSVTEMRSKNGEEKSQINTRMEGLEASMTEMRSKNGEEKSQINTRMEGLETSVTEMRSKNGEEKSQIDTRMEGLETSMSKIETKITAVTQMDTKMEEMHKDVTKLESSMTKMKTTLDKQIDDKQMKADNNRIPSHIQKQYSLIINDWKKEDLVFYEVRSSLKVQECINANGIVTVTGNAGSGKSSTIRHVALQMENNGYEVIPVLLQDSIHLYLNPDRKQLFVLDDPFGKHILDKAAFRDWINLTTALAPVLTAGENTKVLCSIRRQVLNDPDFMVENNIFKKLIINLQDGDNSLNDDEKMNIIKLHLELNNRNTTIPGKALAILKKTQDLYPFLCKMFASADEFYDYGWEFFSNPFKIIIGELDKLRSNCKVKYDVLVLCFVFGNSLDQSKFDPFSKINLRSNSDERIAICDLNLGIPLSEYHDAATSLLDVYLRKEGQNYTFIHDLILDVFSYCFGTKCPKLLLKVCSSKFLCNRIVVKNKSDKMTSKCDPYLVLLPQCHLIDLAERLVNDLKKGTYNYSMMNECWDDESFMEIFTKYFHDKRESSIIVGENDDILDALIKPRQNIYDELKMERQQMADSGSVFTWSWFYHAMYLLDHSGITALHWAITFSHKALFNVIWSVLSSEQIKQIIQKAPLLHFACIGGDIDICRIVMKKNDDFHRKHQGYHALHCAALKNANLIHFLIENCGSLDVNAITSTSNTALFLAAAAGNKKCCAALICKGASINCFQKKGMSPLIVSCLFNHIEIVKFLLEKNCNVDLQTKDGVSALMFASCYNHIEIVKFLLEKNCNVDLQNKDGWSALMFASRYNHIEIVKFLLEKNCNVDLQNIDGESALMCVSEHGHKEIVQLLLEKNCNVDFQNKYGESALMFASRYNHIQIVKFLLEKNCNVDFQNKDGWSALMFASRYNHIEIVKLLLEKNCNVDLQNKDGESALMCVSEHGHKEIVQLLLEKNCNVGFQYKDGWSALMFASRYNHIEIVQLLLEKNCNVDFQNKYGESALMFASRYNHIEIVKLLLEKNCNVDFQNKDGWSALMFASRYNHIEIVKLLLEKNCNVDFQNKYGESALMFASRYNHIEIVKFLLEKNCNVDLQNKNGVSALMFASRYNHIEIVKLLLEKNCNVDLQENEGWSALMFASRYNHIEIVKFLLEKNCNVDIQENEGWSALMSASLNNHIEIVKFLLEKNYNVDFQSNDGVSALMSASRNNHIEIVKFLLEKNCNVDLQNIDGVSALLCVSEHGHKEIVKFLLEKNCNVDFQNKDGWSALMFASRYNHIEIVKLLLEKNCNVDFQSNDGWSALMFVSEHGHKEIIQLLLEKNCYVDLQNKYGVSALMFASRYNHIEIVKFLLEKNCNVDLQNKDGWSALMSASRHNHIEIVQLLLEKNCNVDLQNKDGWSALMSASRHNHIEIVQLLLEKNCNVDLQKKDGVSALIFASRYNHIEIVQFVLEKNCNVDIQDNDGWSALMYASEHSHKEIVQLLLEKNCNVPK